MNTFFWNMSDYLWLLTLLVNIWIPLNIIEYLWIVEYCWILANISEYLQIIGEYFSGHLSRGCILMNCFIYPSVRIYINILKIFIDIRKYSPIFANIQQYSQIFTNIRKYSTIFDYSQIFDNI
jgi:hypothetical protein